MCHIDRMCAWAAAAVLALAVSGPVTADSLEVSPTTLTLDALRAGVLHVANRGGQPITVQVEAFDWRQPGGKDQLESSHTLQVSPPIIRLASGERQIVRVLATPKPAPGSEQAFRLVVSELPDPAGKSADGIRLLLQFKVPVFVSATEQTPRRLNWSAIPAGNDLTLRVSNDGVTHVKLARLHVLTLAGQNLVIEPESFFYVLAGATREWSIPEAGVTAGTPLRVEGVDASDGTKINDAVVASR